MAWTPSGGFFFLFCIQSAPYSLSPKSHFEPTGFSFHHHHHHHHHYHHHHRNHAHRTRTVRVRVTRPEGVYKDLVGVPIDKVGSYEFALTPARRPRRHKKHRGRKGVAAAVPVGTSAGVGGASRQETREERQARVRDYEKRMRGEGYSTLGYVARRVVCEVRIENGAKVLHVHSGLAISNGLNVPVDVTAAVVSPLEFERRREEMRAEVERGAKAAKAVARGEDSLAALGRGSSSAPPTSLGNIASRLVSGGGAEGGSSGGGGGGGGGGIAGLRGNSAATSTVSLASSSSVPGSAPASSSSSSSSSASPAFIDSETIPSPMSATVRLSPRGKWYVPVALLQRADPCLSAGAGQFGGGRDSYDDQDGKLAISFVPIADRKCRPLRKRRGGGRFAPSRATAARRTAWHFAMIDVAKRLRWLETATDDDGDGDSNNKIGTNTDTYLQGGVIYSTNIISYGTAETARRAAGAAVRRHQRRASSTGGIGAGASSGDSSNEKQKEAARGLKRYPQFHMRMCVWAGGAHTAFKHSRGSAAYGTSGNYRDFDGRRGDAGGAGGFGYRSPHSALGDGKGRRGRGARGYQFGGGADRGVARSPLGWVGQARELTSPFFIRVDLVAPVEIENRWVLWERGGVGWGVGGGGGGAAFVA